MRHLLPLLALALLTACTPAYQLACPGNDLHRCEGMSKSRPGGALGGPLVHDADGIKDHDTGWPDGHGGTMQHKGSDPDEKGDNGGGSTEN